MQTATIPRSTSQRRPLRHLQPQPVGHRVTIDLEAYPQERLHHGTYPDARNNAAYWEDVARDYIFQLCAALTLHKQITSGRSVPRSLTCVLMAAQRDIGGRIKTAIQRHTANGGTRAAVLTKAWENAA